MLQSLKCHEICFFTEVRETEKLDELTCVREV